MVKKYFDNLNELMNKIYPSKLKEGELVVKHFFSGAAVYVNGKICMTMTPVGFAIKLPEENRIKLLKEKDVKPLRYFPKAPIKKEYVVLSESRVGDLVSLRHLVKISVDYVNG